MTEYNYDDASYERIQITNSNYVYSDTIVIDRGSNNEIVFCSIVGSDTLLKNLMTIVKKKVNGYIEHRHSVRFEDVECIKEKKSRSDFSHMIIYKRDIINKTAENEFYCFYFLYECDYNNYSSEFNIKYAHLIELLYDKLYANTAVPILEEWTPYILGQLMEKSNLRNLRVYGTSNNTFAGKIDACKITFDKAMLKNIISRGITSNAISIRNTTTSSQTILNINNIDDYLSTFGEPLATKIQNSFQPVFTPKDENYDNYSEYVNNYDDSVYHMSGKNIYGSQKAIVEAVSKVLKKRRSVIVVGDMGTGNYVSFSQ